MTEFARAVYDMSHKYGLDVSDTLEIVKEVGEKLATSSGLDVSVTDEGLVFTNHGRRVSSRQLSQKALNLIHQRLSKGKTPDPQFVTVHAVRNTRMGDLEVRTDIGGHGLVPDGARFRVTPGATLTALLVDEGNLTIYSLSAARIVHHLFNKHIPDVANGTVKVHRIVREPGSRTLISVYSTDWEVNPLQACLAVNQKGLRTIESMLVGSESLKIVEYQDDPKEFVRAALEPAEVTEITIHGTLAKVSVPDRQRSIAVGLHGREVRLAGKLTGYHINVL